MRFFTTVGKQWSSISQYLIYIWRFPEIGLLPSHHPCINGISHQKNHPFGGIPIYGNPKMDALQWKIHENPINMDDWEVITPMTTQPYRSLLLEAFPFALPTFGHPTDRSREAGPGLVGL